MAEAFDDRNRDPVPGNRYLRQSEEEFVRLKTGRRGFKDIKIGLEKIGLQPRNNKEFRVWLENVVKE